ncbi:MAG: cupin domain-containing protein [Xanthobacteraceae bacterium]
MPIVIVDPATVALDPAPITPGWIVEGQPEARAKELARSDDGTSVMVAWSCTAGRFHWHYSVDETVHVISGEVWVTNEDGVERRLGPGAMAFFPAGSSSVWRVPTEVRKLAVCRHALPQPLGFALRAWRKLIAVFVGGSGSLELANG